LKEIKRIYVADALTITTFLYIRSQVPILFTLAASVLCINYLITNVLSETQSHMHCILSS